MKMKEKIKNNQKDVILDLERRWEKTIPKYSEKEWLDIFPEAKSAVLKRIRELEKQQKVLINDIKEKLTIIENRTKDEFSRWFWREWVKYSDIPKLLETEKQLNRLKSAISEKKSNKNSQFITDEDIQKAKEVSIVDIASSHLSGLRKIGKNYVSLCPFHQEKHPSFYLYPETNTYHCYGCRASGDVINLVMKLYNLPFKEAVQFLLKR